MIKENVFTCCDCGLVSDARPDKCVCGCECFEEVFKEDLEDESKI